MVYLPTFIADFYCKSRKNIPFMDGIYTCPCKVGPYESYMDLVTPISMVK